MPSFLNVSDVNINGLLIKTVTVHEFHLTVEMIGNNDVDIVGDEIDDVLDYVDEMSYFELGNRFYNPAHIAIAYVDDSEVAYIMDVDGEILEHSDPDEVERLRAAVPQFRRVKR